MSAVTIDDIRAASTRIKPYVHRTPLLIKSSVNEVSGFDRLFWKCEALQRTGSFKLRGAVNAVFKLVEEKEKKDGGAPHSSADRIPGIHICSHSGGNWAIGLARACKMAHCEAHIVLSRGAPRVKVSAVKHLGAHVVFSGRSHEERVDTCDKLLQSIPGSAFINQYDDANVIAGHGVLGLELIEQFQNAVRSAAVSGENQQQAQKDQSCGAPDVVILPFGGAGLLAGVAAAIRAICPKALIVGCESASYSVAAKHFKAGKLATAGGSATAADKSKTTSQIDGMVTHINPVTFELIKRNVDDILVVSDKEIQEAMQFTFQRLKVVIEPSAACAAAVALFHRSELQARFPDRVMKTAVVVLAEGNIDVAGLAGMSKI